MSSTSICGGPFTGRCRRHTWVPGTNAFGPITTLNNLIDTSLVHNSGIPVPIMIGTFNSVSPTAFSRNELQIVNNQVEDGSNNGNPFLSETTCLAGCPRIQLFKNGHAEFYLAVRTFLLNNTSASLTTLSIDLGDGAGARTVSLNTPITANYTDTGWFTWTIKAVLSNSTTLQCYSKFYVAGLNGGIPVAANEKAIFPRTGNAGGVCALHQPYKLGSMGVSGLFDYQPFNVNSVISVPAWPTVNYDGAYVPIQYSSKNTSGKLLNPLIVVRRIFLTYRALAPDIASPYEMADFVQAINDQVTAPYGFNTQLDEVGEYDLVFVTFYDGTDDITRNAALLEYVIGQVNTLKAAAGGTTQNVVMGMSMGGLVARYALADMTKKGLSTGTRLLITHDSPHEGANVPLGLQYLIEMLGGVHFFGYNISNVYPQYNESINLLNQPATQQMLLYCATGPNTFANNSFLSGAYRTMITFSPSGPQPAYQVVATSLGSQCAHALFAPYTQLINIKTNDFPASNSLFSPYKL